MPSRGRSLAVGRPRGTQGCATVQFPMCMLTHIYSLCNAAVQTCSNHRLARSEFVHGPNLVSEPF